MALQLINIGSIADDGTGDDLRTAFQKINSNLSEIYSTTGGAAATTATPNSTVVRDSSGDIYVNKAFFKNVFSAVSGVGSISAASYPGMFIFVAGDGAYFSNGTAWKKIPNWNNTTVVNDAVLRWNGTEFVTTDAGVKSFNTRTGEVTLTANDITGAMGTGVLTDGGGRITVDSTGNMTFGQGASLGVTGFIRLPSGTTAQRPVVPVVGMFRYNNETNAFEGYVGPSGGPAWRTVGPLGTAPATFTDITATGTATVANLLAGTGINGRLGTTTPNTAAVTTLTASGAATFSNTVTLTSNTAATALGTGALVIANSGGASVGGRLYVGGIVTSTNSTQSTSVTSGAVITAGGAGIGKNLYVGGNAIVNGTLSIGQGVTGFVSFQLGGDAVLNAKLTVGGQTQINNTLEVGQVTTIYDLTQSTAISNGALVVGGGVGIGKNLNVGGTVSSTGSFAVNGTKFTVAADTGNTAILGNVAVNTNKFTVASATGNTAILGDVAVNTDKFTVAASSGNTLVAGTLTNSTLTASKPVFTDANKALTSAGTVPTTQGGTGLQSFTQYGIVFATSTSDLTTGTALSYNNSGSTGILTVTGEVRATNNVTGYYSSDRRLKNNIVTIADPLTKIGQIDGVNFDWTDEYIAVRGGVDNFFVRQHDVGVVAQQVQTVVPEAVAERPDGYLGVQYEKLIPLLIESVKALKQELAQVRAELAKK